jgi:hypothetical protein
MQVRFVEDAWSLSPFGSRQNPLIGIWGGVLTVENGARALP